MPSTLIGDVEIYYELFGDGLPLVFLNGSGSTIAEVRPLVRRLAERFQVVIADYRGMGRSSGPATAYGMADLAGDTVGLVDHLGWESFRLLGVSFGGMVAQEVAVTVPERISRMVLMCTSSGGAGGSSYPLHAVADLAAKDHATLSTQLLDTRFTAEWLDAHPADRDLVDGMSRRRATPSPSARDGARRQLTARADHDVFDRLGRITSPTFVASGRFDGIAPPANGAAIAAQILGAVARIYDGGHAFFLQDPVAMADAVDFLR
ncbi:alpha/beta fold hydrolase [Mycolicibacterium sp. P1-18]|uniref:alpha/beta fold hydrolase n=1 Tax=Mycolicibacterium sp. P1-18 TaxID=2024615 RepID=UPI0011F0E9F5|nr:alpha/beta fold hydrolase [Mycolicibacterium sp. P1-18]KAA0093654.1 alpha/beta fold hydrolase [Mycolicibacterium sp. P1-18]